MNDGESAKAGFSAPPGEETAGPVDASQVDSEQSDSALGDSAQAGPAVPGPKRTAAEALQSLADAVRGHSERLDGIDDFIRACKSRLLVSQEATLQDGFLRGLEPVLQAHGLTYQQASATGGGSAKDSFESTLLKSIESDLQRLGIQIIVPESGAQADYLFVKAIGNEPATLLHRSGRIATVHACGYKLQTVDGRWLILKKAEVTVFKKGAKPDAEPDVADEVIDSELETYEEETK